MIFKRRKQSEPDPETAELALFRIHPTIERLWSNTELNRTSFDSAYLPVLFDVIQHAKDDDQRDHILRLTSGVMVARCGFRLGKSLPIEDSDRISNRFTLALVACVLLEIIATRDCTLTSYPRRHAYALALLRQKLGETAFDWLWKTPAVFNDLCNYFVDPDKSEIRSVVSKYFTREDNAVYRYLLPSFVEAMPATNNTSLTEGKAIKSISDDGRKISFAHQYVTWLTAMIKEGLFQVNERNAIAHITSDGNLFLITPWALEGFADTVGKKPKAIKRSLVEKKWIKTDSANQDYFKASVGTLDVKGIILLDAGSKVPSIITLPMSDFLHLKAQ